MVADSVRGEHNDSRQTNFDEAIPAECCSDNELALRSSSDICEVEYYNSQVSEDPDTCNTDLYISNLFCENISSSPIEKPVLLIESIKCRDDIVSIDEMCVGDNEQLEMLIKPLCPVPESSTVNTSDSEDGINPEAGCDESVSFLAEETGKSESFDRVTKRRRIFEMTADRCHHRLDGSLTWLVPNCVQPTLEKQHQGYFICLYKWDFPD